MMLNQGGMQQIAGQPRMMIRNIGQQPPAGNLRQVNLLECRVFEKKVKYFYKMGTKKLVRP